MINILIVEDQEEKSVNISDYLNNRISEPKRIEVERSLRGGLRAVLNRGNFDLILLDMSMPNFDPSFDDPLGGTPESFAGLEFVSQLKLRQKFFPLIVITQYRTFEKGRIDLESIDEKINQEYGSYYHGSIYYSSADNEWQTALSDRLREIGGL